MSPGKNGERRKFARYALKADIFMVFRPAFDRLGVLKDISLGGAAFEYPVFNHYQKVDEAVVDIFTSQPEYFMLRQVPCRVVYDVEVNRLSLSGVETRRSGVKFERLTAHHRQLLKQLIANCGRRLLTGRKLGAGLELSAS